MQHSKRIDSFCADEEHFFASYEAERDGADGSLTLAFDAVEARPPTAEQLAQFTRFRRPVAWVMAAMGSFSLVALGSHGFQPNSRREVVAQHGSTTALPTSAKAKNLARVSALPSRSVFASAAARTSEAPWSWTTLAANAIALFLDSRPRSTSGGKFPSLPASTMQASLVNDFTSALLCMCRDARS